MFLLVDENSHIIIHRGINMELCKCLDQLYAYKDDARTAPTIHAILSALRNLAIARNYLPPLTNGLKVSLNYYTHRVTRSNNSMIYLTLFLITAANKLQLLEQGILTHLMPYIECENTVVTSKLVGVLRLLVDKNGEF